MSELSRRLAVSLGSCALGLGLTAPLSGQSGQSAQPAPKGEPIALLPYDEGAEAVAAELDRWVK